MSDTNTTPQSFIGGVVGSILTNVVTKKLEQEFQRPDVPVPSNAAREAAVKAAPAVVEAIQENVAAGKIAIVPVKSPWFSKINWTQGAGLVASLLAAFGLDLSAEDIVNLVLGVQVLVAIVTWLLRSFFNKSATAA